MLVEKCDKSTMTDYEPDQKTLKAMSTLTENAILSKGARPKKILSNAQLTQIHNALHSHLAMAGHYMAPVKALPPKPPSRTSSLRWSKAKARVFLGSADPMPQGSNDYY
jgi:formamidopyrimidine-DNA glycosylase